MSYYYDASISPTRGWAAKCRPCDQSMNVSGIICEKPSNTHIVECQYNQFECGDQSCILFIYKCDLTTDCSDGSDEKTCDNIPSITLVDQFIILPCLVSDKCARNHELQLRIHSVCDGIYIHDSILEEKELCSDINYNTVKPTIKIHVEQKLGETIIESDELLRIFIRENRSMCHDRNNIIRATANYIIRQNYTYYSFEKSTYEKCNDINHCCKVNVNKI